MVNALFATANWQLQSLNVRLTCWDIFCCCCCFFYSKIYIFQPRRKQATTTIITNLCKKHQGPCNLNWTPPINDLSSSVCPIHLSVPYFFNIHMTCDSRIADVVVAAVSVVDDWRCCLMNCNEIRYENYSSLVNFLILLFDVYYCPLTYWIYVHY